jgi:hypothetical protein
MLRIARSVISLLDVAFKLRVSPFSAREDL